MTSTLGREPVVKAITTRGRKREYIEAADLSLLQTRGLPGARSGTRASDAERDRAADALRRHHADGRLSTDELEERTGLAYAATTLGDLDQLFADLPRLPSPEDERGRGGAG